MFSYFSKNSRSGIVESYGLYFCLNNVNMVFYSNNQFLFPKLETEYSSVLEHVTTVMPFDFPFFYDFQCYQQKN